MEEQNIQIKNLTHYYRKSEEQKVINDIHLDVTQGDFIAIQGKSGSGKSTILKILGGLMKPVSGSVMVNGIDITKLSERQLAKFRRETIGFVFQGYHLFQNMTALKNVEEPLFYSGVRAKERRNRAMDALVKVGLEDKIHSQVQELSGGQQQRVSIARALVNNPDIILADEPTGNLDSETERVIIELFLHMNQQLNKTVIVVTHNDSVANAASEKVFIKQGGLDIKNH